MTNSVKAQYDLQFTVTGSPELRDMQAQLKAMSAQVDNARAKFNGFTKPMNDNAKSMAQTSNAFKVAAFQVQDFVVQVQNGVAPSKALAMQLPQLVSGMGAFGVALGTAAGILIPFAANMKIVQDNMDRVIGYATGLAVVLSGKFLFGLTATAGGFMAAARGAIAFAVSLRGLKAAIVSTGVGVLVIALGEAVAAFIRLRELVGSWGSAAQLVFRAVGDSVGQLIEAFKQISTVGRAVWAAFASYAQQAFGYIVTGWGKLIEGMALATSALGMEDMAAGIMATAKSVQDSAQVYYDGALASWKEAQDYGSKIADIFTPTEAQRKLASAFFADYQGSLSATTEETKKSKDAADKMGSSVNKLKSELDGYKRSLEGARTPLQAITADLAEAQANLSKFGDFLTPEQYQLAVQQIEGLKAKLAELNNPMAGLKAKIVEIGTTVAQSFASGITDAFVAFATGAKSAKEAFTQFAADFLKQIAQMIVQSMLLFAIQSALGMVAGSVGGSAGGILSGIAGGLGRSGIGPREGSGAATPSTFGATSSAPSMQAGRILPSNVAAPSAGGTQRPITNININNATGASVKARQRGDGTVDIDILEEVLAGRVARGGSKLDRALQSGFGLKRAGR